MNNYHIWPTTITEAHNEVLAVQKEKFMVEIFKYHEGHGRANEFTGHFNLHHIDGLEAIYREVGETFRRRFSEMALRYEDLQINVIKSWPNVVKDRPTPIHNHLDAHMSFVYYVNVPEEYAQPLNFSLGNSRAHPNDPYPNFLHRGVNEFSQVTCPTFSLKPVEGNIVIFPSHALHGTPGTGNWDGNHEHVESIDDLYENRVAIAGDVIFNHISPTPEYGRWEGLQPIMNWRVI